MMKSILPLFFLVLISTGTLHAQTPVELHFLQKEYQKVLAKTDKLKSTNDFFWHAQAQNTLGDNQAAIRTLEEGLQRFPEDFAIKQLLSSYYFDAGSYRLAKPLLLEIEKLSNESFRQLVRIFEFESKPQEALLLLEREYAKDTNDVWLMIHLAQNYQNTQQDIKAIQFYDLAMRANPEDQLTRYRAVKFMIKIKDYRFAEHYCEEFLKTDSLNSKFLKLRAIATFNQKAYTRSKETFYKLVNQGDSSDFVYKHIAICEVKRKNYDTALIFLEKLNPQLKDDFEWNYYKAKCLAETGKHSEALAYLHLADSLSQPDPKTMETIESDRAAIFWITHQPYLEAEAYKKAFAYTPNPEYLYKIAQIYHKTIKDLEQAIEYYEKFLVSIEDIPPTKVNEDEIAVSYENLAKENIRIIKEELFFRRKEK